MTRQTLAPALALAAAVAFVVIAAVLTFMPFSGGRSPSAIGGPFDLIDQNKQPVTEKALLGSPSIVFFGFTHCPDVCPTALTEISALYKALGADGDRLKTFFITVDPERDTADLLKLYLESFDPRIKALTGPRENVDAAMRAYRAFARKVPLEGSESYVMDHTALVYLMDKDGYFLESMNFDLPPEQNAERIRKLF